MCMSLNSSLISDLVITLIGSFAGVYLAIVTSRRQEIRNNKDLLIHFSGILDDIVTSSRKQIKNVNDLSTRLKEKPLDFHLIGMIATLDFERVKSVDSNILYKTYNHYYRKSLDEFKKTFAYIDYLGIAIKDFFSRNEKHINFTHNDQIFVRDQIENLIYKIGMYVTDIKQSDSNYGSNPDYLFLAPFTDKLSEIARTSNNDLSIYESEILTPLNNTILHELNNREVREELFRIVKQSKNRLDSIRYNSIEFANSLIQDFDILEKAIKHLENISAKIKKT